MASVIVLFVYRRKRANAEKECMDATLSKHPWVFTQTFSSRSMAEKGILEGDFLSKRNLIDAQRLCKLPDSQRRGNLPGSQRLGTIPDSQVLYSDDMAPNMAVNEFRDDISDDDEMYEYDTDIVDSEYSQRSTNSIIQAFGNDRRFSDMSEMSAISGYSEDATYQYGEINFKHDEKEMEI